MAIPSTKSTTQPAFRDHSSSYSYFYRYAAFTLFAKEVDVESYADIQRLYLSPASRTYKEDFQAFVTHLKQSGRKAISEDLEFIFSLIKEPQSTVSAVRSATIKRTGTVAKTLRSPMLDGSSRADKEKERAEQEGKLPVSEIFDDIVSSMVLAVTREETFILDFRRL